MNIRELLGSKRFKSAIIGLIVAVLVNLVPDLETQSETLTVIVGIITSALIGGYAIEDMARAKGDKNKNP